MFSPTSDMWKNTCSVLRHLRCLRPHEEVLGSPPTASIFIGGKFFGNGLAIAGTPPLGLEAHLARAGVARTCGTCIATDQGQSYSYLGLV
jgi:hypothetical protein